MKNVSYFPNIDMLICTLLVLWHNFVKKNIYLYINSLIQFFMGPLILKLLFK